MYHFVAFGEVHVVHVVTLVPIARTRFSYVLTYLQPTAYPIDDCTQFEHNKTDLYTTVCTLVCNE
jgi:hypothetical protein